MSAGRTRSSHASSESRNDATMITIDTVRLTLATMAARLTAAWPGAPRNCASASRGAGDLGSGSSDSAATASRGISISVPISSNAIAAYPNSGNPATGGNAVAAAPSAATATPGATGAQSRVGALLVARFQCLRGRGTRGLERGHEAAGHGRRDAESEEEAERERLERQRGHDAAEVAGSEVRARPSARRARERESEHQPERASRDTDQRPLGDDQRREPPARDAQHPQQRELRAPADDRMRLRREHEQATREEGDECEHVEIDPVRPGQARARREAGLRAKHGKSRRQRRAQSLGECRGVDAWLQAEVDPTQDAQAIERGLGTGDVHHREALVAGSGKLARHAQRHVGQRHLHVDGVPCRHGQPARRRRTQEQRIGAQRVEAVGRSGDQAGLDECRRERHRDRRS